jgi:hypothetical protein
MVDYRGTIWEVVYQVMLWVIWIFDYHPEVTYLAFVAQFQQPHIKITAFKFSLDYPFAFFAVVDFRHCIVFSAKIEFVIFAEVDTREECHYQVVGRDGVEERRPPVVRILDGLEKVVGVVGLAKVVLDVVVLGADAQLDERVFKSSALLKKTMHFALNFHFFSSSPDGRGTRRGSTR